ncbi:hypothetical protein [Actinoplanes xinjiangensis]|uniref:hypothetical protein n=1 Tax=Actinoplanes xinjiangensis TaxID=512350 RepID=UPI00342F44A3
MKYKKTGIVWALSVLAAGVLVPEPSWATVSQVNMAGVRSGGHYFADGDVVRTFAGTFIGDFTSEDCQSAAHQISALFEESGQRVTVDKSAQIELENSHTMLVLGAQNETKNSWNYVCVNIARTGTDTYYYQLGNGPYSSSGWVEQRATFNTSRYVFKFADNDNGAVTFAIL